MFYLFIPMLMNTKNKVSSEHSIKLSRYVYEWVNVYVPTLKTNSSHTERSYRLSLSLYVRYLESEKGITSYSLSPDAFSVEYLRDWLLWLKKERNITNTSCNIRMAAIKSLIKYIGGEDPSYSYLYLRVKEFMKPLKQPVRKVNGMSRRAVKAILSVPNPNTRIGLRDLVLMMLSYGVAARVDEILSLTIKDVSLDAKNPNVMLHGKGDKYRSIYLQDSLVKWLKRYITVFHGHSPQRSDYLFYSSYRREKGKLTQPAIAKRLKIYAELAHEKCDEVPLNLHSHLWRHSMACHWRDDNINIVEIKELMGHSSLQSTMIYQDVTEEQKLAAIESLGDVVTKAMTKKWKNPRNLSLASAFGLNG